MVTYFYEAFIGSVVLVGPVNFKEFSGLILIG